MRRYDLDWVRISVFALLIFYHLGMFFVPWNWHVKNDKLYSWLQFPMIFVNQWRLPVLFVISGMGTRMALSKKNLGHFLKERTARLLIPLIFGMIIIVAPQVYIERVLNNEFSGSFLNFYPSYFNGIYPEGNFSWHHLWFLPYLFVYSVILSPIFILIRNNPNNKFITFIRKIAQTKFGMFFFLIPLLLVLFILKPFFPVTHNLIKDWFNFFYNLLFFFYGFVFIAMGEVFWNKIRHLKKNALILGIISYLILIILFFNKVSFLFSEEIISIIEVLNTGSFIIAVLGYANKYLSKYGKRRAYLNQAVYPFYILHQTIIIIIVYFLNDVQINDFIKFVILLIGTFGGSWLIFELVKRTKLTRIFFGIKKL